MRSLPRPLVALFVVLGGLGCTELKRGMPLVDGGTDPMRGDGMGMGGARADGPVEPDFGVTTIDVPSAEPGATPDQPGLTDGGSVDIVLTPECASKACSGAIGDGCCPAKCTPATDSDCSGCGNSRLEDGEACDPPGSCPTACEPVACMKRLLEGSAAGCTARCVSEPITTCTTGDNCCPSKDNPACNSSNDKDCDSVCDNGVQEPGENCEPKLECAKQAGACISDADFDRKSTGDVDDCTFRCVATERQCAAGDGFCPKRCDSKSDADCSGCGNGKLEGAESCDPPASCAALQAGCVGDATTVRTPTGKVEDCSFRCDESARPCGPADGFCPGTTCTAGADPDCQGCGNGKREGDETCDPPAMCMAELARCTSDAAMIRTPMGKVEDCTFFCHAVPRGCLAGDGLCSPGCGPATDPDCVGCGNGKVEGAESCDPPVVCRKQQGACVSDANKIRMATGDVEACTFRCVVTDRTCGPADMFCPTLPTQCFSPPDPDCKRPPGASCTPTTANLCHSNLCVDARCCKQNCGPCQDCGADGSCAPVINRADPPECTDTRYCNATGACATRKPNGAACTLPIECTSNVCNLGGTCGPRADNETCRSVVECTSGRCTAIYKDGDNDGVPATTIVERRCGAAPTVMPGTKLAPANGRFDCCDVDARVKPGATAQAMSVAVLVPACSHVMPPFDFDCSGIEEKFFLNAGLTCAQLVQNPGGSNSGWVNAVVPACGVAASMITAAGFNGCLMRHQTQLCR